jgi:hypothetical protein
MARLPNTSGAKFLGALARRAPFPRRLQIYPNFSKGIPGFSKDFQAFSKEIPSFSKFIPWQKRAKSRP